MYQGRLGAQFVRISPYLDRSHVVRLPSEPLPLPPAPPAVVAIPAMQAEALTIASQESTGGLGRNTGGA